MRPHLFLTGATGFIGVRLLERWLRRSEIGITLLVRPRRGRKALDRVTRLLEAMPAGDNPGEIAARVEVVEGDLSQPGLGLDPAQQAALADRVTHVLHCGAAVRFNLPRERAEPINIGGTRAVVELAARCRGLERLDYVSTAYVAGDRRGVAREDELDLGQGHHNVYERTKFEAERLVATAGERLPVAIHRPSIVICDARTGEVPGFSAFYWLLRGYARGGLECLPGEVDAPLDIVPADYVADAVYALARDPATVGGRYHLTAGAGRVTTLGAVVALAQQHFHRPPLTLVSREEFEQELRRRATRPSIVRNTLVQEIRLHLPYLFGGLRFDNTRCAERLAGTNLQVPPLASYFGRIAERITGPRSRPASPDGISGATS